MGIPFYGQTFKLANSFQTGLNAPVVGSGDAGPITLQKGMLSYMELCKKGENMLITIYCFTLSFSYISNIIKHYVLFCYTIVQLKSADKLNILRIFCF